MEKIELSIIILNWNTKEITKDCIESLAKANLDKIETIIVDNASKDGSIDTFRKLQKKYPEVNIKIIENDKNYGFSKGNNIGAKAAKGQFLFLLNSDTRVKKHSIEILLDYLKRNKDVAAVSPMLLNPDGSQQITAYFRFPNLLQVYYHNILLRPIIMKTWLKNFVFSKIDRKKPFAVDQLSGAALMARKSVFDKTKGLDEKFSFFFEDVDWCYRVRNKGLGKLFIIPSAEIIHLRGASWKKWQEKDSFSFYKHHFSSFLYFISKHYPGKLLFYRLALLDTFLDNAIIHLLRLNLKKAKTQLKLAKFVISQKKFIPKPIP